MRIDWRRYLYQMAFALAVIGAALVLLSISGCASESRGTRANHRVEKRQTQVVIPATSDAAASIVPVTETTEIWEDEKSQVETKSGPDLEKIAPAVAAISGAVVSGGAGGLGLGSILGAVATLATTTGAAWLARGGQVKALKDQVETHKADAQEGWQEAKAHQQRAEQYALKLPPTTMDDHA
jgi:Flp pilus assembly protein TadB